MAYAIQEELNRYGLLRSYNRLGFCTDNTPMESFYHSLKGQRIRGGKYSSSEQLRQSLCSYINQFYNQVRIHSGVEYLSPINYEHGAA